MSVKKQSSNDNERNKEMKKQDKEIIKVLTIIEMSAKSILKNVKKKDTLPLFEAEQMLKNLKSQYSECSAAE